VLEQGPWLIHNVIFILRKWTPSSMLTKEELMFVPVWIKFHGVPILAFTANGVYGLYRALKDTMVISVLDHISNGVMMHTIMVEYEWKPSNCRTCLVFGHDDIQCPKHVMADLRKQGGASNGCFQIKKTTSTPMSNSFSALEEDNEKPMDDLVDDIWKKMEVPPKKTPRNTGIWSDRKADSTKEM
ncbi:ATPase, F1/V1/A1 complex, alpha/beta subunit, partial [Tanacetum coccineum]